MGYTYTAKLEIQAGPPVVFNEAPLPPYPLKTGDTIVFELDDESTAAGWTLQSFALNASAWYLSTGAPIILGGAFQSLAATSLSGKADTYVLPGTSANFTLIYTTGASGKGVGFTFQSAGGMEDVIVSIGVTLTAMSPAGDTYTSHDPQVILGPQR